jgi:hypothetical protein
MRILIIALFSLFILPLQSQGIIDKMANLTCECMEATGYENKSQEEVTKVMSDCLTEHLIANIPDLQKELDVEITNQEAMRAVGEKIGAQMANICPAAIMALAGGPEALIDEEEDVVSGRITAISDGGIATISIVNDLNQTEELLWLTSFEGDEPLLALKNEAIGKKVAVQFQELDIYSHKDGAYFLRKIITALVFED